MLEQFENVLFLSGSLYVTTVQGWYWGGKWYGNGNGTTGGTRGDIRRGIRGGTMGGIRGGIRLAERRVKGQKKACDLPSTCVHSGFLHKFKFQF